MIKVICDITGKTPAVPVQIIADGKPVLTLDMCQVEVASLVQEIMGKIKLADVSPVMKVDVVAPAKPV